MARGMCVILLQSIKKSKLRHIYPCFAVTRVSHLSLMYKIYLKYIGLWGH